MGGPLNPRQIELHGGPMHGICHELRQPPPGLERLAVRLIAFPDDADDQLVHEYRVTAGVGRYLGPRRHAPSMEGDSWK